MALIDEVGFDSSFSFIYSPRPGTPAADLADDTPQEVKLERLARLQKTHRRASAVISERMVGTRPAHSGRSRVEECRRAGRAHRQQPAWEFSGNLRLINQFVEVNIASAYPHSLRGEIVIRED